MYNPKILNNRNLSWHPGVVVINTVQLPLPKSKIRFCAGSNPGGSLAMVPDIYRYIDIYIYIDR